MKSTIVPVKNVRGLAQMGEQLRDRPLGTPGIALVWGRVGLGKTTAVAWYANQVNAVFVRAYRCITPLGLLQDICAELGLERYRSHKKCLDEVTRALAEANRPLFIDEADYLVESHALIETVRDVHDLSDAPLVLIGMEQVAKKVRRYPQFESRVMQWMQFAKCDAVDARQIADDMLEEVRVDDDLLAELLSAANGEIRRLVVGLGQIEAKARQTGIKMMGKRDFKGQFFLGHLPKGNAA